MENDFSKEKQLNDFSTERKDGEKVKEVYVKPVCQVEQFEAVDVLTASPIGDETTTETTTKIYVVDGGSD